MLDRWMMRRLPFLYALALLGCEQSDIDAEIADAASAPDTNPPDASVPPDAGPACQGPPGLYLKSANVCSDIHPDLLEFEPQYPLWTDGARKERFIYLPQGTTIDATDPNAWAFPVGTRVYKNFYVDGLRVETRFLEKITDGVAPEHWLFRTFAWDEQQLSVEELVIGRRNVLGTSHTIPAHSQCITCHSVAVPDTVLGFSAIQLNHASGLNLDQLNTQDLLIPTVSTKAAVIPGNDVQRAALGVLHGNCGHCHGGQAPIAGQSLWVNVGHQDVEDVKTYETTIGIDTAWRPGVPRIVPGDPEGSAVFMRMSIRDLGVDQMPPIGTDLVDANGMMAVRRWISELPTSKN